MPANPTAQQQLIDYGIEKICEKTAECVAARTIAKEIGVSWSTMMIWIDAEKTRVEQYARAREAQADKFAEDILSIADESTNDTYFDEDGNEKTNHEVVARSKLRVDARKWLASKMYPKRYGDKLTQEISGPNGGAIQYEPVDVLKNAVRGTK